MTVKPLAEALLTLLNDKQRREQMGRKGIITAQKYDWEGIARRVMEYYQKTIEKVRVQGKVF
jgi:glycosyltransferase involved in cell wall biosynthesis